MEYKVKPWAHQLAAIERAKFLRDYALFMEPGTGKTLTAIGIVRHKFNAARRYMRTIIFAPPVVLRNWKDEWAMHSNLPDDQVVVLRGPGEKRVKTLKETKACIVITNYETFLVKGFLEAAMLWCPEIIIYDESHFVKASTSKRTKAAIKLSRVAKHRYILTGTPVLKDQLDLFNQFLVMDCGALFGQNFFIYRATYFWDANSGMPRDRYFPNWKPRVGCAKLLAEKMAPVVSVARKSECLDLPPLVKQKLHVGMNPDQEKAYLEMKKDFITYMEGGTVVATLAITKALRLMQISSGFAVTDVGDVVKFKDTPKMAALREILEQVAGEHKVVVWTVWKSTYRDVERVLQDMGLGYRMLTGETKAGERDEVVDAFRKDPAVRVLIGNPHAAGIGINLTESSYSIFYSRNFSLGDYLQAEARNYRGGSEMHQKITHVDLITEGTIDEAITEKLLAKQEITENTLREVKNAI